MRGRGDLGWGGEPSGGNTGGDPIDEAVDTMLARYGTPRGNGSDPDIRPE